MIKNIFLTLLGLMLLQNFALADLKSSDIVPVMSEKLNSATALIKANKKDESKVANKLYEIFDPMFDYELMAKISLGSKQYKSLTKSQKEEYLREFEKKLKNTFADYISLYTDQKIEIKGLKDVKKRKVLLTKLVGKDTSYPINYRFYNSKTKGWLIYDIKISSVSIVQSYINQFSNVVFDEGFDKLISMLKSSTIDIEK